MSEGYQRIPDPDTSTECGCLAKLMFGSILSLFMLSWLVSICLYLAWAPGYNAFHWKVELATLRKSMSEEMSRGIVRECVCVGKFTLMCDRIIQALLLNCGQCSLKDTLNAGLFDR